MAGLGNFSAVVQTSIPYATFSAQKTSIVDTSLSLQKITVAAALLSLQKTFAERS
ncbi:hypothetical protein [Lysinibacillus sphaericus]|uniref:hypothetical protein n=1 Tax=Lysinibacillus sphaericus TaxID=1421 RepID=UPI00163CDA17|nr:hypothetical protein [Lysinibacillus sp. SDF0037]